MPVDLYYADRLVVNLKDNKIYSDRLVSQVLLNQIYSDRLVFDFDLELRLAYSDRLGIELSELITDQEPPYVYNLNPFHEQLNVLLSANILLSLGDLEEGVDISTLTLTLDDVIVFTNSQFTSEFDENSSYEANDQNGFDIVIDSEFLLSEYEKHTVVLSVADLVENWLYNYTYWFYTGVLQSICDDIECDFIDGSITDDIVITFIGDELMANLRLRQIRYPNYDSEIFEYRIGASIIDAQDISPNLFVVDLDGVFKRVVNHYDLANLPTSLSQAEAQSKTEYRTSGFTVSYDDLDVAIAAKSAIIERVNSFIDGYNKDLEENFITTGEETDLPIVVNSELDILIEVYVSARNTRIQFDTIISQRDEDRTTAKEDWENAVDRYTDVKNIYDSVNSLSLLYANNINGKLDSFYENWIEAKSINLSVFLELDVFLPSHYLTEEQVDLGKIGQSVQSAYNVLFQHEKDLLAIKEDINSFSLSEYSSGDLLGKLKELEGLVSSTLEEYNTSESLYLAAQAGVDAAQAAEDKALADIIQLDPNYEPLD